MRDLTRVATALQRRRRRSVERALADEWLLWGAEPRAAAPLLAKRASELTAPRHRRELASLCRRLVAERRGPRCRAYAVNRVEIGAELPLLVALAARLEDGQTVSAASIVRVERLLRDGAGPLYDSCRGGELNPALAEILAVLDRDRASDPPPG